jgi:trimeric autotransporter adhesin
MVNMGTSTLPNWQTILYTSGWSLTGNAIASPSANFIGTTNDQPLTIRVNNIRAGYINGYDIAFGNNALTFNQDFNNNIALGRDVMFSNYYGYSNIAIGARALRANIDRSNLIAIGDSALFRTGSIGMQTAEQGTRNTAIGSKTLYSNTRGYGNTAIGYNSLLYNVEGNFNIGIGDRSLYTSIGNNNTAIGNMSQFYNNSNQNTTVGDSSLFFNGYGNANTALGFRAGYSNDVYNSTFLGANTNAVNDVINSVAIGYGATVSQSNFIQLGDSTIETVNTYGNITVKNGKGIIRSADGIQQKKLTKSVAVNTTIPANTSITIPFTFPENFSDIPDAYIGDITLGFSFVGVMIYVSGVSASGGIITVFNPRITSFAVNFTVKVIAIGPQ